MSLVISRVYTTWAPDLITTALWLDAADASTVTLNGSTVSQWRDKSGNSRHASQVTAANQPTYAAAGFNAKPTIQFDGADDRLDLVQFAQVSDQNVFAVVDTTNIGTGYRAFLERNTGTAQDLVFQLSGVNVPYKPYVYWGSERAAYSSTIQRKAIIRWAFASGSPASALTQVDGGAEVSQTFSASTLSNWSAINFVGAQSSDVDISEIIMTPASLSAFNRQKLEGYLAWKWGLTANLPTSHPFKWSKPEP